MSMRLASVVALAFLASACAGCLGAYDKYDAFDPDREYKNPGVFPGNYTFGNDGSTVLSPGLLKQGEPEIVHLRSTLPAYAAPVGDQTSDGTVIITMAIWHPQNATGPVPTIVDAGPYYEQGQCKLRDWNGCHVWDNHTIDEAQQTTKFSLKNFLPHGYAVAQVAVRGTGTSGGCMDLLGPAEQHDLMQAIDWIGEQPWSNGNVGMLGGSYDGATQWELAATGDPHLKAIVPTASLPSIYDLMFHNGTAETRGPIMHDLVYWPFGFSADFLQPKSPVPLPIQPPVPPPGAPVQGGAAGREQYQDMQNLLCPELYQGAAIGGYSWMTGDSASAASPYWAARDYRERVIQNYKGSVFLIHGLQDWNVDGHSVIPFNTELRAAGLDMKEWYGQWDHNSPDGSCFGKTPAWATMPCRLDFAETLLRWYDHSLKGTTGVELGPSVQVEDNVGYWRNVDSFPPKDPAWMDLHLSGDGKLAVDAGAASEVTLQPGTEATPGTVLELKGDVLTEDLRFSGLPQLHVPFQPQGPGGQLAVWLFDQDANNTVRATIPACDLHGRCEPGYGQNPPVPIIGHGQLNLRYYAGGDTAQAPLVAGQTYMAMLQLEPLDVLVPKGHRLVAWVFQGEYPEHMATMTPSPVKLLLNGDAVLRLPTVTVDPETIFPVPGAHFPSRELYEKMDVLLPAGPMTDGVTLPVQPPVASCTQAAADVPATGLDLPTTPMGCSG